MKVTNKHGIDPVTAAILTGDSFDPRTLPPNLFWTTALAYAPMAYWLERRHWDEIEEDVSERAARVLGSAWHEYFEQQTIKRKLGENSLLEEKAYLDTSDWSVHTLSSDEKLRTAGWFRQDHDYITAKLDSYTMLSDTEGVIMDRKTGSVWSYIFEAGKAKPDEIAQTNIYAYAVRKLGFPVTRQCSEHMFKDWSRSKRGSKGYPPCQITTIEHPQWTDEQVQDYIELRVEMLKGAKDLPIEDIDPCSPDERWQRVKYGKSHDGKCLDGWCKLTKWCPYYQEHYRRFIPKEDRGCWNCRLKCRSWIRERYMKNGKCARWELHPDFIGNGK